MEHILGREAHGKMLELSGIWWGNRMHSEGNRCSGESSIVGYGNGSSVEGTFTRDFASESRLRRATHRTLSLL